MTTRLSAWPSTRRPPTEGQHAAAGDAVRRRNVNATVHIKQAATSNDPCTPMPLPTRPTITPLKVRMPSDAMLNRPSTRPRMAAGAFNCTSVCTMLLNDSSRKPAENSNGSASP